MAAPPSRARRYCGTNANCQKGVPNIGASFVPAMKAGMAVVFLEYGERDAPTCDIYNCLRWIARVIMRGCADLTCLAARRTTHDRARP